MNIVGKQARGAIVIVAIAVTVLGACGSSSSKGSANPSTAGSKASTAASGSNTTVAASGSKNASGKLCDQFTAADAGSLFGTSAVATTDAAGNALGGESCVYQNKDRSASNPNWLLQVRRVSNPEVFDSHHVAYKSATNLSGIGDAAFIAPDVVGTGYTIQVKQGNDVYTIDLNSSNLGGAAPTVSKDAFVALVRSTLG